MKVISYIPSYTSWAEPGQIIGGDDETRAMLEAPRAMRIPVLNMDELRRAWRHLRQIDADGHCCFGIVFAVSESLADKFLDLPGFVPTERYAAKVPISKHEYGTIECCRVLLIPGYICDASQSQFMAYLPGEFVPQREDGYDQFVAMLSVVLCAAHGIPHRSVFTPIEPAS